MEKSSTMRRGGRAAQVFSKAQVRLSQEMGAEDPEDNAHSFAVLLVADGRQRELERYEEIAPGLDDRWIPRAKAILSEEIAVARARHETRRSVIGVILREDARQHPEFAEARAAAVVGVDATDPQQVTLLLETLVVYEGARWGRRAEPPLDTAFRAAREFDETHGGCTFPLGTAVATYERARRQGSAR